MKLPRLFAALTFIAASSAFAEVDAPAIWKSKCKGCHGDTGKADTKKGKEYKVEDLTIAKWQDKHTDDDIKKGITEGVPKTKMKGFKDKLSAEEIDALVKHVRTLKQ